MDGPRRKSPAHPGERASRRLALLGALLVLALTSGCTSVRYLAQAGAGQISLGLGARGIQEVMKDRDTPPRLRRLLWQVESIKRFGERHGLTATGNYTAYVALDRPAVVWVVSASEPLRFKKKTWSFPIVGSVPYLGWFDKQSALDFAAELRRDGWDVDVRGADAYSTLGWFRDPILSTMIPDGDEALGELTNVILHESVHATLYIEGQSVLNESIANFIGDRLTEVYLDEEAGASAAEQAAYAEAQRKAERRRRRMHEAYRRLERLYASPLPKREKLEQKRRILDDLRRELAFKRPINNATLAQFKTYNTGKEALEALLAACGGSFPRMLAALGRLREGNFSRPQEEDLSPVILPLARAGCR